MKPGGARPLLVAALLAVALALLLASVAFAKYYKTTMTVAADSGGFSGQLTSKLKRCLKGREIRGTLATHEERDQLGPVRTDSSGHYLLPATVPSSDYFLQVNLEGKAFPKSRRHITCGGDEKIINTSA